MKIVVTGASGNVGRSLVPRLRERGVELLLVGRDVAALNRLFPGIATTTYENLASAGAGHDLLVHLAVANTDSKLPPEAIHQINVDWTFDVAVQARAAGIPAFVNISSIHALDERNQSPYARSKREAATRLAQIEGLKVYTSYMAAVHDGRYSGRLAPLNKLPPAVGRTLFTALSALKPTLRAAAIADYVMSVAEGAAEPETILADDQDRNPVYLGVKRMVDLGFALGIILFFNWLVLLLWALVRLESKGPGFFVQERVGVGGRSFRCYKFRSMHVGTKEAGTHEVSQNAITRMGSFMRRTKLDELPQAWNILCNDMSLVGPRPCLPSQRELVDLRLRSGVLRIKPGITGLAQVNGIDMSDPALLVSYDSRYMRLRSLLLDVKIVIATAIGRGQGDKVQQG